VSKFKPFTVILFRELHVNCNPPLSGGKVIQSISHC